MTKAFIVHVQVKPINDRELDSAMFVYEKIKSIIKSCTTSKQALNCINLCEIYSYRFPNHYEFYRKLRDFEHEVFNDLLDKQIENHD